MREPSSPQFLDLRSYRRRRLVDAAKLLPVLGAVLFLMPLPFLFTQEGDEFNAVPMSIYLFAVWLALIVSARILAKSLQKREFEG